MTEKSFSHNVSGRKKDSSVWHYFDFNESVGYSVCKVIVKNTKQPCGTALRGKYTTNLKLHLFRKHKSEYDEFKIKENYKNINKTQNIETINPFKNPVIAQCFERKVNLWPSDSKEYITKSQSVVDFIMESGCPVTLVDKPSFRLMIMAMDRKFNPPGSGTVKKLIEEGASAKKELLKWKLNEARKVSICIDAWSNRPAYASFVGISACFFDTKTKKTVHAILNLKEMTHPHTGDNISNALQECLMEWNIPASNVLQIVFDNGSNMLKAIGTKHKILQTSGQDLIEISDVKEEEEEEDDDDCYIYQIPELQIEEIDLFDLEKMNTFVYLPCLVQTIKLLTIPVYDQYKNVIIKARKLVHQIRRSGCSMELLISLCGKSVVSDCVTRSNSTYMMIKRLIFIKIDINYLLESQGIDTFIASEWSTLEEISALLEPFTSQTDVLQSDAMSLSNVLPSILNLECHLQQSEAPRPLCHQLLEDLRKRFEIILNPNSARFNPLPAAACLLDPSVRNILFTPALADLLQEAKKCITTMGSQIKSNGAIKRVGTGHAFKKFKFLATAMDLEAGPLETSHSITNEVKRYLCQSEHFEKDIVEFWVKREEAYPLLSQIAQDLTSAPASQAAIERMFSICGC